MAISNVDFRERYRQALAAYISDNAADAEQADSFGIGRAALDGGLGLVELLSLHQSALLAVLAELPGATAIRQIAVIAKAEEFLSEVAAPFEMTHLGWRDAVERLRRLNESLERQVAERIVALRESERRFQDIAEVSGDWMWETDREHRFTSLFGERIDRLPLRPEPLIGQTRWEGADADPASDAVWGRHRADLDAHRPFRHFRYELRTPAGATMFISASGKPVFDAENNFLGYRGTATDETPIVEARRRAEAAELTTRRIFETSQDLIVVTDRRGILVRVSPSAMSILGYEPDNMVGASADKFMHPEDIENTRDQIRKARRVGRAESFECRFFHAQGRIVTLWWTGVWSDTEQQYFYTGRDVTERKEAERRLRESEDQLNRAQRLAGIGSDLRDLRTGEREWSDESYRIFGVSRDTFTPTLDNVFNLIHPDDRHIVLTNRGKTAAGICPDPFEYRIIRPDGEVRHVYREWQLLRDEAGDAVQLLGTLQDITERKRAEETLRRSEELLKRAQRLAHMGSDLRNLRTDEGEWSDESYRIFGVSRETFVPSTANFLAMVHPDDRATVLATREQIRQGICPEAFEYRIIRPDGTVRQIYRENELIRNEAGEPLYLAGTVHDITERKRAEERVRLLQGVSLAIAEAKDFKHALSDVLRMACDAAGWPYAAAWIPDALGNRLVLGAVWHADRPGLEALAAGAKQIISERGVGIVGRVWDTGQPLWVTGETLAKMGHPDRIAAALSLGVKSSYALPLRSGSEILAVIAFIMFEDRAQNESVVEMISAVGAQLGAALHRKRIEESLQRNARLLDAALEAAQLGSWVSELTSGDRLDGRLEWSRGVFPIFDLGEDEFDHKVSTFWNMVHPEDRPEVAEARRRTLERDEVYDINHRIVLRDGTVRWVHQRGRVEHDAAGAPIAMLGVIQDVTEARIVEEQLRQSQKMEAIGNLTGGMAHDFNNLLGIIVGNLGLAREQVGDNADLDEMVSEALEAAWRGADLTRRLLAFARRQPLQPVRIEVNDRIADIVRLLRRLLGEDIEVRLDLASDTWPIVADPAQLEAALANLATNARDAMPRGGRLIIATGNCHLDAEYVADHAEATEGDFVMIEVSDTGTGMPPEVVSRVFEPFFTTKEAGKGTGLGLSMVFGFLRQSGGHVSIYSEPGAGTTFRLYLPRAPIDAQAIETEAAGSADKSGGEIVLVVEDNPGVRRIVVRQLRNLEYQVLECERAAEALDLLQREAVDLLFTDIVMPGGLDGVELARLARERWPTLKVVLTSGFPQARFDTSDELLRGVQLISKPYTREELAAVLQKALRD